MLAEFQFGPIAIENPKILIAQIIGFVLFAILVWKMPKTIPLGVPFLKDATSERSARIEDNLAQVETAVSDTQRIHDDYLSRLRSVESEANQRIEAAVREAEEARAGIIAEAEETSKQVRRRAEDELAREQTKQRILLRQKIVALTLDAAEKSAREHSTANTQRHLISDFIARAANDAAPVSAAFSAVLPTAAPHFTEPVAPSFGMSALSETPVNFDRTEGA